MQNRIHLHFLQKQLQMLLTLKFTFNKATLHHVEEDCDHDVQQVTLLCHTSSKILIAEQLHTNMYNAVGHGVRLVAFHQCFHDECIMLNECFCKGDLPVTNIKDCYNFVTLIRIHLSYKKTIQYI